MTDLSIERHAEMLGALVDAGLMDYNNAKFLFDDLVREQERTSTMRLGFEYKSIGGHWRRIIAENGGSGWISPPRGVSADYMAMVDGGVVLFYDRMGNFIGRLAGSGFQTGHTGDADLILTTERDPGKPSNSNPLIAAYEMGKAMHLPPSQPSGPRCVCGAHASGSRFHSSWCDMAHENIKPEILAVTPGGSK